MKFELERQINEGKEPEAVEAKPRKSHSLPFFSPLCSFKHRLGSSSINYPKGTHLIDENGVTEAIG
jgi:hypothetical protein